ncbi:MAG TPA: hypothetical protein VNX88_24955 [Terriglobales bacterium]|jgi:hypothetical protein|nr:hypothetical protein [Terriglobales bacterium]
MAAIPSPAPGGSQKLYYFLVLEPMWRGQLDALATAEREFRWHLLAVECLRIAKGPGSDPLDIAEFCRKWQIPLTLPMLGPTSLLRKIGKLVGGWPSTAAVFDPTGAINMGIKVIGRMGPLIGQIQMRNAMLVGLDEDVISKADQSSVLSILESSATPQNLMNRVAESKARLEKVWKETTTLAEKMNAVRNELGLPDTGF